MGFPEQSLIISVELAQTLTEREYGLMYRTQLEQDQGMLFVFPDQAIRKVWMKNTYLALDVLFLNEAGLIVDVLNNLPPCKLQTCQIYSSRQPAKYMLELHSGFFEKHSVKPGQKVSLPAAVNGR